MTRAEPKVKIVPKPAGVPMSSNSPPKSRSRRPARPGPTRRSLCVVAFVDLVELLMEVAENLGFGEDSQDSGDGVEPHHVDPGFPTDTVIVSNEGAGYIPEGVFLPRTARVLFSDPRLDKAF